MEDKKKEEKRVSPVKPPDPPEKPQGPSGYESFRSFVDNPKAYDPNAGMNEYSGTGDFLSEYKMDVMDLLRQSGSPGRGPNSIHGS